MIPFLKLLIWWEHMGQRLRGTDEQSPTHSSSGRDPLMNRNEVGVTFVPGTPSYQVAGIPEPS